MQHYDVIGDVHGHATKLENLLGKMGYKVVDGAYTHPTRKALFVGDYIDRGTEEARTIHLVKSMVEAGSALAIMGNHEFNAICYATPHPDKPGEFLRPHTDKNFQQHQAFLAEFPLGSAAHKEAIEWFKTLPVYLDLDHIRVVHACWHQPSIDKLKHYLTDQNTLPEPMYYTASIKDHEHYTLVENIVKALEHELPEGVSFLDKDGNLRTAIRVKWWSTATPTYNNLALTVPDHSMSAIPNRLIDDLYIYQGKKPVFFGHYWLKGTPSVQAKNVACTDYSAGKGGELIAYRWSGESTLNDENFCL